MNEEEDEIFVYPPDLMSIRALVISQLAEKADKIENESARNMVLHAMNNMLFSITPEKPKAQLVVLKGGNK